MGKIKKLQDKGATILPLTVADAVLMNSTEAGNLSTYLEALKSGVDFLLSIIGEDQAGDIFLKTKDGMPRGFYTEGFVSAGGKSTTEGGGGTGGANLTQMWESLQGNNDTFKDRLINVDHIPTLTTGKISDFVSATQAIADTAVANKADKDKVVDLTSNQTISGKKSFEMFYGHSSFNILDNVNSVIIKYGETGGWDGGYMIKSGDKTLTTFGVHGAKRNPYYAYVALNGEVGNTNPSFKFYEGGKLTHKTLDVQESAHANLVTNLNAEMVGGYNSLSLFTSETIGDVNAPNKKAHGSWIAHLGSHCSNVPSSCDDGKIVHFSTNPNGSTSFQLASSYYGNTLFFRSGSFTESSPDYLYNKVWKKVAFTDSDITGNAASATKLQTARTIWGQSFNGTANISGKMTNVTSIENTGGLSMRTNILSFEPENAGSLKGALIIGGTDLFGLAIWGVGSGESYIQSGRTDGKNAAYNLIIQHLGGKVGIGTNAPIEKLHVQGNIYSSGSVRIDGARLTYGTGTLTVDKSLTVASTLTATQGEFANYIKIGNATISWNPKGYLEINEGLASQKFISAGGVVTGDAGGGG